jgi:hypothetical protein
VFQYLCEYKKQTDVAYSDGGKNRDTATEPSAIACKNN